ncbi:hypothetical protein B4U37_01940 [Sutcliffiella horikoshii]|uniref:Uncharacterized protein n=1 Tax=Sutcliffiella horikoshii TaxID=79883 RepID=A0ABM6KER4_9BACI|nr:hypothetical protein [Sutcliffiella horikoshii]ART74882.1 hypothetical protein B4U37_01940 [Sutcliffiella horikoshii]
MKKTIGKLTHFNMYILIISFLFVVFNLTLMNIIPTVTFGSFYAREIIALLFSFISLKLFFKVENRYAEEDV